MTERLTPEREQAIRQMTEALGLRANSAQILLAEIDVLRRERDAYKAALVDSRRQHYHCDDSWYCCGACTHPDHGELDSHAGEAPRTAGVCNCGAAEWNQRVNAALAREERS